MKRSSRNVCSALSAFETGLVPELAEPALVVDVLVAAGVVLAAAAAGALLVDVVVVAAGVDVLVLVLVVTVAAGAAELLGPPRPIWPSAWNTASMKALKPAAPFSWRRAPLLPSLSPSLSFALTAVVLVLALAAEPEAAAGVACAYHAGPEVTF